MYDVWIGAGFCLNCSVYGFSGLATSDLDRSSNLRSSFPDGGVAGAGVMVAARYNFFYSALLLFGFVSGFGFLVCPLFSVVLVV